MSGGVRHPRLTARRSVRIPDYWRESDELAGIDHAARWHLLSMLLFCAANGRDDGWLRDVDARRCSDAPDPDDALRQLVAAELIVREDGGWQIVDVPVYLPSPGLLAERQRRATTHILYRIWGAADELLYVGRTCDLRERLGKHALRQPWWHEVVRTTDERLPTFHDLVEAEKRAIVAENPKYNLHRPGS